MRSRGSRAAYWVEERARLRRPGRDNRVHMALVGAAAPSEHGHVAQSRAERDVARGQRLGVSRVELDGLVELRVAPRGRVRAQARDPVLPGAATGQDAGEVRRVRAVDHVVGGGGERLGVDLLDRLAERLPAREPPVGLDGERDRRRESRAGGGARDPDRLVHVRHRDRGDEVGAGGREGAGLGGVVALGFARRHLPAGLVAVAARADHAADQRRRRRILSVRPQRLGERDRLAVDPVERGGVVAELRAPVAARAPGDGVEEEPRAVLVRRRQVRTEVIAERRAAIRVVEQRERREGRQLDPATEDERGLEAAVRQEHTVARELGKRGRHVQGDGFCAHSIPGRNRRSRSAFETTETLESAMASPESSGLSSPAAASGSAATL
jgi:hypothetical protein